MSKNDSRANQRNGGNRTDDDLLGVEKTQNPLGELIAEQAPYANSYRGGDR